MDILIYLLFKKDGVGDMWLWNYIWFFDLLAILERWRLGICGYIIRYGYFDLLAILGR